MRITLGNTLPPYPDFVEGIRRAPDRGYTLTPAQTITALKNALRYIPSEWHEQLAPEFMEELRTRGRIYGYRFRPAGDLKAKPIDEYQGQCIEGKAFQVMIDNNLCFDIALYPYELVTYGETGQVCQNWMQYRLIKQYLEELTQEQTLVIESGHPLGLFRSRPDAPRVIITNSMMIGQFDNQHDWHIAAQMGVANYGQMTAGGWMYIGPQGIVHGTFNTLLNAGRLKLGIPQDQDLRGHLFISSGLGGMSGAQPKAAEIAGAVSIIAEVDRSRIETRYHQGWVGHVTADIIEAYRMAAEAMRRREPCSIAYHGNIVDLLEYAEREKILIELLSDQTSCHAVYEGGYCPAGLTFEERTRLLHESPEEFRHLVDISLHRHFEVIKKLVARGTYFFDYGNSFMKAIYDAGVKEISYNGVDEKDGFIWPSYVEDIMGPQLFDYGYGPFRWVCLSGKHEDLIKTDHAAMECIDVNRRGQDLDNYNALLRNTSGVILLVGPTGSGKSTTMCNMIRDLSREEINIVTLEDPVEYHIPGVSQCQINEKTGMTFASGLRAILRQDPDIISVGEIRDGETAEIAMRAAMTGHLVITTIHTEDAISAIDRLRDMGVPPYLIAAGLRGVISQRLLRRICPSCREQIVPPRKALELAKIPDIPGRIYWHGAGCDHCFRSGYRGRIGVFEVMVIQEGLRRCIMEGADRPRFMEAARRESAYIPMSEHAQKLLENGTTTVDEIIRTLSIF